MKLKTAEEIEILATGGAELARIMRALSGMAVCGARASDLDAFAEQAIRDFGGAPSFKGYGGKGSEFPNALCVSPNDMVVHGIPYEDLVFQEGDIIGLDLGMEYKILFTDHAITVPIGKISAEAQMLLAVTKECLKIGITKAVVGNHIGDIGHAVQTYAEQHGYGVVRQLTGHGVGHAVHEEPHVPNFGKKGSGEKIVAGMVLAIEPMVTIGTHEVATHADGWGIVSKDNTLAAHFEHTVAITEKGNRILTM